MNRKNVINQLSLSSRLRTAKTIGTSLNEIKILKSYNIIPKDE